MVTFFVHSHTTQLYPGAQATRPTPIFNKVVTTMVIRLFETIHTTHIVLDLR